MIHTTAIHAQYDGEQLAVDYSSSTGRLRIFVGGSLVESLLPPHSWCAIATVTCDSSWGTRPTKHDLQRVLENFGEAAENTFAVNRSRCGTCRSIGAL